MMNKELEVIIDLVKKRLIALNRVFTILSVKTIA